MTSMDLFLVHSYCIYAKRKAEYTYDRLEQGMANKGIEVAAVASRITLLLELSNSLNIAQSKTGLSPALSNN